MSFETVRIGPHAMYCGDARECLGEIQGVDCVVTDPPYQSLDVEVTNGTTTRLVRRDEFSGKRLAASDGPQWFDTLEDAVVIEVVDRLRELVGAFGSVYVFADVKTGLRCLGGARNVIVWDKCSIGMGYAWRRMHEWIGYFPGAKHRLRDMGAGDIIRCRTIENKIHPTEKPVQVIERLIENSTDPRGVVCDPFMGSGSTGEACVRLGRLFCGIEKERKYFDIACRRVEQAMNAGPLWNEPVKAVVQSEMFGDEYCEGAA